jgi:energy-coupling factor transporter ATP-binding protein EcfA2
MIQRLYVNNFRCLENFELPLNGRASTLLVGSNGAGKSTVRFALEMLQRIARGANRVGVLVKPKDFFLDRSDAPMRFEVDVELGGHQYQYRLALELPANFRELRVLQEQLALDGQAVYSREHAQVSLPKKATAPAEQAAKFLVDWHLVALPLIQEKSEADPLAIFKRWFARSLILAPIPSPITGESSGETLEPDSPVAKLGEWFAGLVAHSPAVYTTIIEYLKEVMPDLRDIKNPLVGAESRSLKIQFGADQASHTMLFSDLSDGEKCFFVCAFVLAASEAHGPVFCFWDEPDSHLSLAEVGHFVTRLRRAFEAGGGQLLMSSHNPEAIRRFSDENTVLLYRSSHLEPTRARLLDTVRSGGDVVSALLRGEVAP